MQRSLLAIPLFLLAAASNVWGQQDPPLRSQVDELARQIEPQVIAWRRDIHEHPELGNREYRTGKLVADHLRQLSLEVRAPVAHTGVVGVLRRDGQ